MTAYTDGVDLFTVSTSQILFWLEGLSQVEATYDPETLIDAGFTIPAAITRLKAELMKRSLARVYTRRLYKPIGVKL